jgi:hypothetical protein
MSKHGYTFVRIELEIGRIFSKDLGITMTVEGLFQTHFHDNINQD